MNRPNFKLSNLSLLTPGEKHKIFVEWNQTDLPYPDDVCLHQLFERQVSQTPDAVAVVFEEREYTYSEINIKANQLAYYLRSQGIGAETLVGISVKRSPDLIIGLLGILKAGAAYVPLNPDYPETLLGLILDDTQAPVIIIQSALADLFSKYQGQIIKLDSELDRIETQPEDNLKCSTIPDNTVYVIYTSGSTGTPKGVPNIHKGTVNRITWMRDFYGIESHDRILHKTPFSFDVSVWEVFLPLIAGARLVIAQPDSHRDIDELISLIQREGITIVHFVPSLLDMFVNAEGVENCKSLRLVFSSGEALSYKLQQRFFAKLNCELLNLYGPTEASIDVTHWRCLPDNAPPYVPIGRPIANTKIYILDHNQQPVPIGVVGELYIGGIGVARGYLNRPEFTAEKFVADPFSDEPGARLYKTGDLARFLSDGNIEFVGRSDDQVKLRGYRIELGEIEAVLSEHPLVRQVVVLCREDVPGHKRLVAYVVSKDEVAQGATANQQIQILREHVAGKVPDYMVPSAFVLIEALPLTTSGKVNRKALPAADMNQHSADDTYVAPRTEIEERLVRIWSELLSVERIGVHDNFFEIGGDSIISIQVVSRARQQGLQLDVKHVFQSPTIAGLAALVKVEAVDTARKASQDVLVGEVPLTPIQHMFFDQHLATLNHYNQAMLLESTELLEVDKLKIALEHLLVHHDALRLRFKKVADSQWMQEYVDISSVKESNVALCEFIDISAIPAQQQPSVIEREANRLQARLDIERGPVFGAGLFNCGARQSQRLLVVAHHLVVDAVSWSILLEDLTIGYRQLTCGEEVRLPAKTHSYRDWAKALREYADAETLRGELSYWLASASAETTLPVDYEQRENTEAYSETLTVNLGREETQKLLQQVPHAYRTQMPDVLLTALVQAIGDWTGRYSLLLSLESHGRAQIIENIDSSRTCGWFTSIFPVYLQLQEPGNIARSLKEIKEQLRTIPNDGIGYGVLCYLAKVDKEVSQLKGLPQPPLSFNYLGQRRSKPTGDSLLHYTNESIGVSTGEANERKHQLEVTSEVVDGCLKISWSYSRLQYERATVQHVVTTFIECLEKLIERCSRPENFGYTPSDFPLARMEQSLLDELFADRRGIEDIYPLAPMQEGLLFRDVFLPGSDAYFNQNVLELIGDLDQDALRRAWQCVMDHYAILSTGFLWEKVVEPLQYVMNSVEVPWTKQDWQHLSPEEQVRNLDLLLLSDRENGFNLSEAPLFRLQCIQLAVDRYYIVWSHHHILIDGWCLALIWGGVFSAYEQLKRGEVPNLGFTRPYRDYISWVKQQDIGGVAEQFWRDYLAGFLAPTRFSNTESYIDSKFETYELKLSVSKTNSLKQLAQRYQVTLNTIVQAAWSVLLSCYSRQEDIVFGVSVSGRPVELGGIEDMVGLFINTLPLRVQLSADIKISALLRQLQEKMVLVNEYSYVPLAKVKTLTDAGWSGGKALFDSLIAFENYPEDKLPAEEVAGLLVKDVRAVEKTEYPLGMIVLPEKQLTFHLNYDTAQFSVESIERLADQLSNVLDGMLQPSEGKLGDLSLLNEQAKHQFLIDWNETELEYSNAVCVHQLFEEQVEKTPNSVAVAFDDQRLTYQELNAKANQLAHHLAHLGVGPETPVAISVKRSLDLVIGMLGVLKAGGVYVPLDPDYPDERRAFMLEDTHASVLLVHAALKDKYSDYQGHLVSLDADWERIARESSENPEHITTLNQLAYVMYTSGSTGQPKGVMCTHAGLANRLLWSLSAYPITEEDCLLQIASVGFDISVWEMFFPLLAGGRLVVASPERHKDAGYLVDAIAKERVSVVHFVPSLLDVFLEHPDLDRCGHIKHVICGGEALSVELKKKFFEKLRAKLYHAYGPTEASISVTHWDCEDERYPDKVPLGRPIANTKIYILDNNQQPVPIGVTGELYIGGIGLARGYLNRPELTAEKFVADPFSEELASRLYKTGDLGRFLSDGNIEFVGRSDNQIKLRGYRIELGEIQAVLSEHELVRQAVVLCREDVAGDKRLIAYVKCVDDVHEGEIANQRLRLLSEHLANKLPEYMVPSRFMLLDSLPLMANGKVNRAALLEMQASSLTNVSDYMVPRNSIGFQLKRIWENLLEVSQISIHDNFFRLGGHSLLAIRMVAEIQKTFPGNHSVNVTHIFKHPTIAKLTKLLTAQSAALPPAPLLPIRIEEGSRKPLFLVHPGEGLAFAYSALSAHLKDYTIYGINNPRFGDFANPFRSVQEMASCYIEVIRGLQSQGPYYLGGWSFGGVIAFEMARQLEARGNCVDVVILIDSYNLSSLSLQRAKSESIQHFLMAQSIDPASEEGRKLQFELENNGNLSMDYCPKMYKGRVVLFKAHNSDGQFFDIPVDMQNGWKVCTGSKLEVYKLPGKHSELFEQKHIENLSVRIRKVLNFEERL